MRKPKISTAETRRAAIEKMFAERRAADAKAIAGVVAEFNGDTNAMAAAILEYRRGFRRLAEAVEWATVRAPFAVIPPGPYWQPDKQDPPKAA
jgi:hypothetical protein